MKIYVLQKLNVIQQFLHLVRSEESGRSSMKTVFTFTLERCDSVIPEDDLGPALSDLLFNAAISSILVPVKRGLTNNVVRGISGCSSSGSE